MSSTPFTMPEAFWNTRFRDAGDDYLFGVEPNRWLVRHADALAGCNSVLAVADGEGRNSVWLAQQGFAVTASEISPVALAKARKLAAGRQVSVNFERADLLTHVWPQAVYDAVVAVFIQFVGPQERAAVFGGLKSAVKPGGVVLLQGYTPKQLEYKTGGPPSIDHLYTPELLRVLFGDWEILRLEAYEDELAEGTGHKGRSALIGLVAKKPA